MRKVDPVTECIAAELWKERGMKWSWQQIQKYADAYDIDNERKRARRIKRALASAGMLRGKR